MNDIADGAGADSTATLTDGELGTLFESDRVDKIDAEGDVVAWHDHISAGWQGDVAGDIGSAEEELWTIAVQESGVTATLFFGEDVDSSRELIVWDDGSWFGKDLTTFDLVVGDTTEKGADVIATSGEV